jgi:hypothetical protein
MINKKGKKMKLQIGKTYVISRKELGRSTLRFEEETETHRTFREANTFGKFDELDDSMLEDISKKEPLWVYEITYIEPQSD